MRWLRAVVLVFSTYTRIPMPQVKWDDDAMKLSIAFLPLAGILTGAAAWLWLLVCRAADMGGVLFAGVTAAIPVLITGGIHMDGYCDTSDALASWQDKERRLEILKDPRVGAFALIRFGVYMLLEFALLCELYERGLTNGIGWIFPMSRCLAAWSAILLKNARKDGMLAAFTLQADRRAAYVILTLFSAVTAAGLICAPSSGGIIGLALCVPATAWYAAMAKKKFGGVTGDTTGFYLQTVELVLIIGGVFSIWL